MKKHNTKSIQDILNRGLIIMVTMSLVSLCVFVFTGLIFNKIEFLFSSQDLLLAKMAVSMGLMLVMVAIAYYSIRSLVPEVMKPANAGQKLIKK